MALGYIAAFSETLALAVIAEKGLEPLCAAVAQESEDHIRAAAAWSLGQVGRHTPDHAKAVADTGGATAHTYVYSLQTSLISVCPAFSCTITELCNAGRYVHAGWASWKRLPGLRKGSRRGCKAPCCAAIACPKTMVKVAS